MGKGKRELPIDQKLISYYGNKSPVEIAELTGLDPMVVAKRTEEILGERDYLAEDARIAVLVNRLDAMAAEVEQRLPGMSDRNVATSVNAAAGALGRVLKELRELRKESRVDVDAITSRQARELVSIVEASFNRMLGRLSERFPDVDPKDLQSEFQGLILEVAKEYDE